MTVKREKKSEKREKQKQKNNLIKNYNVSENGT